jgi:hypothetical protein
MRNFIAWFTSSFYIKQIKQLLKKEETIAKIVNYRIEAMFLKDSQNHVFLPNKNVLRKFLKSCFFYLIKMCWENS